jgi:hypothetical protein
VGGMARIRGSLRLAELLLCRRPCLASAWLAWLAPLAAATCIVSSAPLRFMLEQVQFALIASWQLPLQAQGFRVGTSISLEPCTLLSTRVLTLLSCVVLG